jgi:hypothetical protein
MVKKLLSAIKSIFFWRVRKPTKLHYRTFGGLSLATIKGQSLLSPKKAGSCRCDLCKESEITGTLWANPDLLLLSSHRDFLGKSYRIR